MAVTYVLRNTASDLSVSGATFNYKLLTATAASADVTTAAQAADTTVSGYAWTDPAEPGANGTSTGSFTVEVNVITAQTDVSIVVAVARVNSAGTVQGTPVAAASQASSPAGIKTFSFTNPALGTWAAGDRLRVEYRFVRAAGGHGNVSVVVRSNTTDAEAATPFTPTATVGYGRVLWAELEVPAAPVADVGTVRVSWVEWQWPSHSATLRVSRVLWQWPLKPGLRSWRIDYTDDGLTATASHSSSQGPPTRTTGVLAVVYWYDPPYRGLHYGIMAPDRYVVDGVELEGEEIPDAEWETYRLSLHAEPHPHEP